MIYLNHAATSYPKPVAVHKAMEEALTWLPEGQFRSSMANGDDTKKQLRVHLARLLGVAEPGRIYFTSGATQSFNMIIQGMELSDRLVLASAVEHNSVLRPLYNGGAGETAIIFCDPSGHIREDELEQLLLRRPAAVFINHCSNVTGAVQDLGRIAKKVHEAGTILVADLSQSAGCIPIALEKDGVDIAVFTGHKSLWGPQGTGGFYIRPGLHVRPVFYGGTGTDSARLRYDESWEGYEVGTQNGPGLAGLLAGVKEVLSIGVSAIHQREKELMGYLLSSLRGLDGISVYAPEEAEGPVCGFNVKKMTCQDTAYILAHQYGIITRAGLHCAPLVGIPDDGCVRVSVSYNTKPEELDVLIGALRELGGIQ